MVKVRKNWRQFSIRALLVLTFIAAIFFAGYRLGFHVGRHTVFDDLIEWITSTIDPPITADALPPEVESSLDFLNSLEELEMILSPGKAIVENYQPSGESEDDFVEHRAIIKSYGYKVVWDGSQKKAIVKKIENDSTSSLINRR